MIFPAVERVGFFQRLQFLGATIKLLIIGAGVAGKALHPDPEKERPASGANFFERLSRCVINLLHILTLDSAPVVRFENVECERIVLPGRHADAVAVVFHEEEHGELFLFGETERLKKISLTRCRIADRGDHEILFAVQLNAPGNATRRE